MLYQTRKDTKKLKITVTYDMGWQKISSGRRYDSSSGHSFIIGGIYKGIVDMFLYSKVFQNCGAVDKSGELLE